jgi:hypothetical protein
MVIGSAVDVIVAKETKDPTDTEPVLGQGVLTWYAQTVVSGRNKHGCNIGTRPETPGVVIYG